MKVESQSGARALLKRYLAPLVIMATSAGTLLLYGVNGPDQRTLLACGICAGLVVMNAVRDWEAGKL